MTVVTDRHTADSAAFHDQVLAQPGVDVRVRADTISSALDLLVLMKGLRDDVDLVIVPEADRIVHVYLMAIVMRYLPPRRVAIFMKPGDGRHRLFGLAKTLALSLTRLTSWRRSRVMLIEDPLAGRGSRVWSRAARIAGTPLCDPGSDLIPLTEPICPPELATIPADTEWYVVLGLVDHRKRLPEILDAWQQFSPVDSTLRLVVAGKVDDSVWTRLEQSFGSRSDLPGSVIVVDRYLADAEMAYIMHRSKVALSLDDGGVTSGIVLTAAVRGRWVIVPKGVRFGQVSCERGIGIEATLSGAGIAEAMYVCRDLPVRPEPLSLPGTRDFAEQLLDVGSTRRRHPTLTP